MFFQEILEYILREQPHNLTEVFRHMYFTDVAHHICQTLFGNVCLHLRDECLQGFAVRNRFGKELVAFLHALLFGKTLVLALDEHPASISQVHGNNRSYHDTLADIVLDGREAKPFGNLAMESIRVFEAFAESTLEQSPGIKEFVLNEKLVDFIYWQIPTAFLIDDIDVKTIELMFRSVAYTLLDERQLAVMSKP